MAEPSIYDEIEFEDLTFHPATALYTYPCPCGDQFEISLPDLRVGEDIAVCPSCSLMIRVIFEAVRYVPISLFSLFLYSGVYVLMYRRAIYRLRRSQKRWAERLWVWRLESLDKFSVGAGG